ncbi:MAG: acetate kinase [Oscillospiraceae bacterium]|jgi:acetate kinase|nr:acetate kinase [Oscillospiraceae bacterium]
MNILVINAGSSSLKYKLINIQNESVLAKGNCERIGLKDSIFNYKTQNGNEMKVVCDLKDHMAAFIKVKDALTNENTGVIKNLDEISAIGHRAVHGGSFFKEATLLTEDVINKMESLIPLAPLHNGAIIQGIKACFAVFDKSVPEVAVFDTAFHSTMPPKAFMFPIAYEYYEKYGIRRYGFHGTSHRCVSARCAKLLEKDIETLKMITCHLGNGSSIAAIKNGKVIDTSMGLTPLDGFMMGSRSGALDPSVVTFLQEHEKLSPRETDEILNKKSGLLGISGISTDDRDITIAAAKGDKRAILAHEMLVYQITKYIGGYIAAMNGCDAIVFTAGLGENQPSHRKNICSSFTYLGAQIDESINDKMVKGKEGKVSTNNSKIDIFVIPTDEELIIAKDTQKVVIRLLNTKN